MAKVGGLALLARRQAWPADRQRLHASVRGVPCRRAAMLSNTKHSQICRRRKALNMRRSTIACSAALLAALLATPATADSGSNETRNGSANAQVVRPLVLSHWAGFALRFGRFNVGNTSGTVSVSSSGSGSAAGGVAFVSGSSTSSDRMIVQGDPNRLVSITTGAGSVSNGSNAMTFTTSPALPAGYIPIAGTGFFTVGGTLNVAAGQMPGSYSGSYPVTVTYN